MLIYQIRLGNFNAHNARAVSGNLSNQRGQHIITLMQLYIIHNYTLFSASSTVCNVFLGIEPSKGFVIRRVRCELCCEIFFKILEFQFV